MLDGQLQETHTNFVVFFLVFMIIFLEYFKIKKSFKKKKSMIRPLKGLCSK